MVIRLLCQTILWIWFLGCTISYRFGKYTLVEGTGFKSAEFFTLCLYSIGLILYHFMHPVGKWFLLTILILSFVIQFFSHWYYTIFGASEKKLKGYNECFSNTIHIFPMSDKRLIPDFYHIIQQMLMLLNII